MPAALRLPLPANGLPAGIGCERCLVRFLRVGGDDLEKNRLLPYGRLTTTGKPFVGGGTLATQGGDDLGGGVVGKVGVETHGSSIHSKNKSAMRKIILVQSPQCGHSSHMKEHERLAKLYSKTELESMQSGYSRKIDTATGFELANARRRYWTFEKAIDLKRKEVAR